MAAARCWSTAQPTFEDFRVERLPTCRRHGRRSRAGRSLLAENRWPWRCMRHTTRRSRGRSTCSRRSTATYRYRGCNWIFDHAETIERSKYRTDRQARRRHRRAAPHGLSGRVFRRSLRQPRRINSWQSMSSQSAKRERRDFKLYRLVKPAIGTTKADKLTRQQVGKLHSSLRKPVPSRSCTRGGRQHVRIRGTGRCRARRDQSGTRD